MELKSRQRQEGFLTNELLIVPYGIEIGNGCNLHGQRTAFNRTIWN